MYIIRDGEIIAKGAVGIREPKAPLGSHVFVLVGPHDDRRSLRWQSVSYAVSQSKLGLTEDGTVVLSRLQPAPDMARRIIELMHPGLVMTLTDLPAHPDTRSGRDFVVVAQDEDL